MLPLKTPFAIFFISALIAIVAFRALIMIELPDPEAKLVLPEEFSGCLTFQGKLLGPISGKVVGWNSPAIKLSAVLYQSGVPVDVSAVLMFNQMSQLVSLDAKTSGQGGSFYLKANGINPIIVTRGLAGTDAKPTQTINLPGPISLLRTDAGRTFHYPALSRKLLFNSSKNLIREFAIEQPEGGCQPSGDETYEAAYKTVVSAFLGLV